MGRGFFSGVLWGSLAAVAGLWLLSQTSDTVTLVILPPEEVHDEAPQGAQLVQTDEQAPPPQAPVETEAPDAEQAVQPAVPEQSPQEAAPEPGMAPSQAPAAPAPPMPRSVPTQDNDPSLDVAPAPPEQSDEADNTLLAPANDPLPETVEPPTAATAGSVLPSAGGAGAPDTPDVPAGAGGDVVAAAPQSEDQRPDAAASQPARPALPASDRAPVATDFSNPQVVEPTLPEAVQTPPAEADVQGDQPASVTAQAPGAGGEQPGALADVEADRPAAVDTATDAGPETADTATADPETEVAEAPRAALVPVVRKAGEAVQPDRVGGFVSAGQGFRKDEPAEDALPGDDGASDQSVAEPAPDTGDLPALQRYAVPFENPEGRPIMAIVLLPDQTAAPQVAALPFEVSFAVDASKSDATRRMAALRDAGREVVLIAPLPDRARPSDVEVAFQEYLSAVPEAVAVMDTENANFQSSRQVSSQVAQILAETGHGMITYSHGLNSATQVAEREGVPAALVFRVFDEGNRDGAAIKRFLDQAAFRAGQSNGVVLVGHNRPDTVRALLEWSLGNRAQTVALAPVSAVLK